MGICKRIQKDNLVSTGSEVGGDIVIDRVFIVSGITILLCTGRSLCGVDR